MQIFISWSGTKSKGAAEAFRDWLPDVFQSVEPWLSSEDISPGKRWNSELQKKLESSSFGIICVTQKNLNAPWILYEAGCLSKTFEDTYVCPVLIDLEAKDIKDSPLSQFQAIDLQKEKLYKLILTINKSFLGKSISEKRVKRSFDKWYPDLGKKLKSLPDDEWDEDEYHSYCDEVYSRNLRDFVCYHQGNLIQYFYLAGEYHKELKVEFRKKKKNINNIKAKARDLTNFINESLLNAIAKSFDEMQKMFLGRHVYPPRICLKANLGTVDKTIVPLVREKRVAYASDCLVSENTGFEYVEKNGTSYLCQNIPESAQDGFYYNPRLIVDEVANYAPNSGSNGHIDANWVKCWRGNRNEPKTTSAEDYHNCYKSTLIVPLTMWNNKLGPRFIEKFRMKDVDRTIFGYLCYDHIGIEYFDPIFDVDSGYVYADILSLYLLVRFVYVDQSKTFNEIKSFVEKKGATLCDY